MVETALSVVIALPMLLWLIELSFFFYTLSVVQYASRAGVQYAVTHGSDSGSSGCSGPSGGCADGPGANVIHLVQNVAQKSGRAIPASDVKVQWANNTSNPGDPVAVTVSFTYQPLIDMPFVPLQVSGQATGHIVY